MFKIGFEKVAVSKNWLEQRAINGLIHRSGIAGSSYAKEVQNTANKVLDRSGAFGRKSWRSGSSPKLRDSKLSTIKSINATTKNSPYKALDTLHAAHKKVLKDLA